MTTFSFRLLALLLAVDSMSTFLVAQEPDAPITPALSKPEAAAVEAFAQDMQAVKDWIKAEQKAAETSEARYHLLPVKLPAQLARVRTARLPATLATPFTSLVANAEAHANLLKAMPSEEAQVVEWMTAKYSDASFNEAIGELIGQRSEIESTLIGAAVDLRIGRQVDLYNVSQIEDRWVVILSVYKDFPAAKADAERLAKASGVPFSMNGMIYDQKGLRYPDDFEDEVFAGQYVSRRQNGTEIAGEFVEQHLSVELSDDYQGFAPGYYMVVGCIAESAEEGKAKVAQFKSSAPDAYVKKTEIYLGCMH